MWARASRSCGFPKQTRLVKMPRAGGHLNFLPELLSIRPDQAEELKP